MSEARPPTGVDLVWDGDLRFVAQAASHRTLLDGDGKAALSPVQALAAALAGCMATDVVHILSKGRVAPRALAAHLSARRADVEPRRFLAVDLHFVVSGDVPPERVERAIALSRETYCSVWQSLRQDIDFKTSFEVRA